MSRHEASAVLAGRYLVASGELFAKQEMGENLCSGKVRALCAES